MALGYEVAITGIALASSLGCDKASLWQALQDDQHGLTFAHRFKEWIAAPLGEVPWHKLGIDAQDIWNTESILHEGCKYVLKQLLDETDLLQRYEREKIGLLVGTTTSGIKGFFRVAQAMKHGPIQAEQLYQKDLQQARLDHELSLAFGLEGPSWTLSTSCAASAQAFGLAADAVRSGMLDAAIVVGADILNLVTIMGFEALQLLDHDYCNPFQPTRKGINLAEAVVMLSLERRPASSGQVIVRGFHGHSEAYHMTQPAPNGIWMQKTMEGVLAQCGLLPEDIAYINPHGTGTQANDSCEAAALQAVFGDTYPLHGTKRLTGHPLGAAGALELALTAMMLPTLDGKRRRLGLSNSFGFGGANVSIVLESLL